MDGIRQLAPEIIAKISAGEVIESPVSAIKELIENSLDAGASNIEVKILSPDFFSFSVKDNGCGMTPSEIKMSVKRYTTSKLESEEELLKITTYGFRGEALFSIASVSRLVIKSAKTDGEGYECYFEGGILKSEKPVSSPKGTLIEVHDIFFNSPVRRRFLRERKSFNYGVMDLLFKYKLSNPAVRFILRDAKGDIIVLEEERIEDLFEEMFGASTENINLNYRNKDIEVSGIISLPEKSPVHRKIYFLVNRRPVSSKTARIAIGRAFGRAIEKGRYPSGIIYLNLPPSEVDVNVHPAKLEVRFRREEEVINVIVESIREGLRERAEKILQSQSVEKSEEVERGTSAVPFTEKLREQTLPYKREINFRILGTLWNEFILVEREDSIVMIDIHAAHEKLIYDRISEEYFAEGIESLLLLSPMIVRVGVEEIKKMREMKSEFEKVGFIVDEFGEREICIRGYPAVLYESDVEFAFKEVLKAFEEGQKEVGIRKLADIACKGAVKSGTNISLMEIESLLTEIKDMKKGTYCPHGRPILYVLSRSEVEKWFTRR